MDTNWELIQFKYEFLGHSLEDLAKEHSISSAVLNHVSEDWNQISLEQDDPVDMKDIKTIDDVLTKLNTKTINQAQAFFILKQKFLNSKYMELEMILLHKAISVASSLEESDSRAATTLKSLTQVLTDLIAQNPLLKTDEVDKGEKDKVWEVRIVEPKNKDCEEKEETDAKEED